MMKKMLNNLFKQRAKALFICYASDTCVKVLKCLCKNGAKKELVDFAVEPISAGQDEKTLAEKFGSALKRLGFNNAAVIICVPRQSVTARHLKVPASEQKEIEKIAALQAAKFLPYPANELVSAYQLLSTDKDGYSDINLIIAHRSVIERLSKALKTAGISNPAIILSSFGLANLYAYLEPHDEAPVLIAAIDAQQAEFVIARKGKVFFSRAIKLPSQKESRQQILAQEAKKTLDAYLKEKIGSPAEKMAIFQPAELEPADTKNLSEQVKLTALTYPYWEKIPSQKNFLGAIAQTEYSLAELAGLAVKEPFACESLLPQEAKEEAKKTSAVKERLRIAGVIFAALLIFGLGMARNQQNKTAYLKLIKNEIGKLEPEAKSLEAMDKRIKLLESRKKKKPSPLDIIGELHRVIPQDVTLNSMSYDESGPAVLRGNTAELNAVFRLAGELEKSSVFKNYNVRVRYATKKKAQAGETVDFEINCAKK